MKKLCLSAFFLLVGIAGAAEYRSAYAKQWKEVDAAISNGLPKSAIEKVEPIIQLALQDKADLPRYRGSAGAPGDKRAALTVERIMNIISRIG